MEELSCVELSWAERPSCRLDIKHSVWRAQVNYSPLLAYHHVHICTVADLMLLWLLQSSWEPLFTFFISWQYYIRRVYKFLALLPLAYAEVIGMEKEGREHRENVLVHYAQAPTYYTTSCLLHRGTTVLQYNSYLLHWSTWPLKQGPGIKN